MGTPQGELFSRREAEAAHGTAGDERDTVGQVRLDGAWCRDPAALDEAAEEGDGQPEEEQGVEPDD
eukprot:scaffold170600_cov31-Tisochrysis_lutea.AAC.1